MSEKNFDKEKNSPPDLATLQEGEFICSISVLKGFQNTCDLEFLGRRRDKKDGE